MMVSITVLTNILFASAALAASFEDRAAERQSNNPQYLEALVNNSTLVRRDSTLGPWAGASYSDAPHTIKRVYGLFAIPSFNGSGSVTVWVGIDGSSCNARLLVGIDIISAGSGYTFSAWYDQLGSDMRVFPGTISFQPGDFVKLTVIATNSTSGTVMIENTTAEQTLFQPITSITYPLCQQDAQWIVEDRHLGNGLANFGTIDFTDAYVDKGFGNHVGADAANVIFDISQDNNTLTSSHVGPASVTVEWKHQ